MVRALYCFRTSCFLGLRVRGKLLQQLGDSAPRFDNNVKWFVVKSSVSWFTGPYYTDPTMFGP